MQKVKFTGRLAKEWDDDGPATQCRDFAQAVKMFVLLSGRAWTVGTAKGDADWGAVSVNVSMVRDMSPEEEEAVAAGEPLYEAIDVGPDPFIGALMLPGGWEWSHDFEGVSIRRVK
jgi:hypothetical protein